MVRESSYTLAGHRAGTQTVGPDNTQMGTLVSQRGTSQFIIPAASQREIFQSTWGQHTETALSIQRGAERARGGVTTRDCVSVRPAIEGIRVPVC